MELFSPKQLRTLRHVCDTLIPSLPGREDPHGFWERNASDLHVPERLAAMLATRPATQQREFQQLLTLLSTPLIAPLAGMWPPRSFDDMSPEERAELLRRLAASPLGQLRMGFQAIKRLAAFLFYTTSGAAERNPNWPAIGYPGPLTPPPAVERPLTPLRVQGDTVLTCDTVIVGSGAGGGVVAGELATAGEDVIVVEKGPYVTENDFTQREAEMVGALYEASGILTTDDLGVAILAGSCLGGGTTVNWSASLRTPQAVLEEWARDHLLPHLLTDQYRASFDAVEQATGVTLEESTRNPQNQALWDSAGGVGASRSIIPRNARGCHDRGCGYCGMGCQYGAKQGTLKTYLLRAVEHGARILTETTVERVLVEQGRAVGVIATQRSTSGKGQSVTIRARRVVVAAGAIHTPAILRRSGLTHPHIGRNLYLHPTVTMSGIYQQRMEPWFGVMMSVMCDEWAYLDGAYGVRLETPPTHPGTLALALPWYSGAGHKEVMSQAAHIGTFIVLTRDRDGGRVSVDRAGRPHLHYKLSTYDRKHLCRGIAEAARLHAEAGARTLLFPHNEVRPHALGHDGGLESILQGVEGWKWEPNRFMLFSAHQMGTCRMGGDAQRHPLTPECETREVRNLFVTDASAFPASSGANPMLSIQTLAHYAAQEMKSR